MKIRVLYEENIKNGHKFYTTIEIPDGDYSIMLDTDYEQRLAEAKPEKKAEVKRCETVQEMFNLMNDKEYNNARRETRHIDFNPKMKKFDGKRGYIQAEPEDESFNIMDYLCTSSDEDARSRDYECEAICDWIRNTLAKKPEWADAFIAVRINGMSIREYANTIGADENNITQKLKRATKKLKQEYKNRQI
ncbi:MAG: sigma-70 family RNA polymerase sigma factor [Clostridia bacterium]|nr:sigma-70 family RNA polymerase sigma factor [Clostridia bacterium]